MENRIMKTKETDRAKLVAALKKLGAQVKEP
jgi:hypothetical protein